MNTKALSKTRAMVLAALFCALTAIGAFIRIPMPFMDYVTLQSAFVVLAGLLLGGKLGALSMALYVALGLLGAPIFAAGGGIGYVFRPSFGYLVGFIPAAWLAGQIGCGAHGYMRRFLAALAGLLVIYIVGITYKYLMLVSMAETVPLSALLISTATAQLPGDAAGCAVAAWIVPRLSKAL